MKAFVSYSRKDRGFLDTLVTPVLSRLGIETRSDSDIPASTSWTEWVLEEIDKQDFLVVVLSESYQDSLNQKKGACHAEFNWIVKKYIERGSESKIVLLWLEGDIPDVISHINAIDLRHKAQAKLREELSHQFARLIPNVERETVDTNRIAIPSEEGFDPSSITGPDDLPRLVRHNFEVNAQNYSTSLAALDSMQRQNAVELLRLVQFWRNKDELPEFDTWLDLGCGTGLLGAVAAHATKDHHCTWLKRASHRLGCDYAHSMLGIAKDSGDAYTKLFNLDARDLSLEELSEHADLTRVGMILCSNVIHWLYDSSQIRRVFQSCRDVLLPGGVLATSIAARGTGVSFISCYKETLMAYLNPHERENWGSHLDNPIGLRTLTDTVQDAQAAQFKIVEAKLVYEPVFYSTTDDYVFDARSYGRDVYLAPVLTRPEDERESVWKTIKDNFQKQQRNSFNRDAYIHDQFMIYLICRRI